MAGTRLPVFVSSTMIDQDMTETGWQNWIHKIYLLRSNTNKYILITHLISYIKHKDIEAWKIYGHLQTEIQTHFLEKKPFWFKLHWYFLGFQVSISYHCFSRWLDAEHVKNHYLNRRRPCSMKPYAIAEPRGGKHMRITVHWVWRGLQTFNLIRNFDVRLDAAQIWPSIFERSRFIHTSWYEASMFRMNNGTTTKKRSIRWLKSTWWNEVYLPFVFTIPPSKLWVIWKLSLLA